MARKEEVSQPEQLEQIPTQPEQPDQINTQPEQITTQPDPHPDLVFGEAVYRWTGNLTFTQHKTRTAEVLVDNGKTMRKLQTVEDDGTEEVHFAGGCLACGEATYAWHSGPHADHMLENSLAVFAPAGKNEPPLVYCQKHDPGIEHRKRSGRLRTDEAEGAVVRVLR